MVVYASAMICAHPTYSSPLYVSHHCSVGRPLGVQQVSVIMIVIAFLLFRIFLRSKYPKSVQSKFENKVAGAFQGSPETCILHLSKD